VLCLLRAGAAFASNVSDHRLSAAIIELKQSIAHARSQFVFILLQVSILLNLASLEKC
jgi:hypothetical protein